MNQVLTVVVVGSRDFPNEKLVRRFVAQLPRNAKVVSGGARGVDTWAVDEAKRRGLRYEEIEAQWDNIDHDDAVVKTRKDGSMYDAMAGFRRNSRLVEVGDWIVAFWDGASNGAKDTIDKTMDAGKPLNVYVRK